MSPASAETVFPIAAAVSLLGSFLLVTRLERLAGRLGLSEAALGLVVALAANSPEITSAVSASAAGRTTVGAGVVLGSNVFNLAALLGLGAVAAGRIHLHRRVIVLEGLCALWVAAVAVVSIAAGWNPGVGLGLALVVVLPYSVVTVLSPARLRRLGLPSGLVASIHTAVEEEEAEIVGAVHPLPAGRYDLGIAALALAVVVVASTFMERSAVTLGNHFALSELVVGGLILAAVTSLPNAVGAVFLASRGRGSAVLSEACNSNMLNVLVGLFVPALFLGLVAGPGGGDLIATWYLCLTLGCLAVSFVQKGVSRIAGVVIVASYGVFAGLVVTR